MISVGRRWRRFISGHHQRLQPRGASAYRWKGGLTRSRGYVLVFLPDHPRADAIGYVRRGVLVAEAKLGRSLSESEVVHHLNRVRDDDRPENLEVLPSQSEHVRLHNTGTSRARKLTADMVREIRHLLTTDISMRALGKQFGVTGHVIRDIRIGKTHRSVA